MFGNFGKMALIRSIIKTRSMEGSEHGNSSGIWERRPDPSRRCVLLGRLSVRPWRMYRIEARLSEIKGRVRFEVLLDELFDKPARLGLSIANLL